MFWEEQIENAPFSLDKTEKEKLLTERLVNLTKHHIENCPEYARMLKGVGFQDSNVGSYKDLPFLPVRLFKELNLRSVPESEVIKTMTSSGTTGQKTSKIYLDKTTSSNQQKVMVKIVSDFTGSSRMPMLIIDCPSVVKDRKMFSARGAGILGFSIFGSKRQYALDDDMNLNVEALKEFLEQNQGKKILLFGFTFMIWQHFYKELVKLKEDGITFDFSNAVMIHGGGWKKLLSEAVSPEEFHQRLNAVCGIDHIHDYYGMVEQTGSIYMQCECGHLHASIYSDVITRNPFDFSECKIGEKGILQVVSSIPESYPGHSLLTEDEGIILGEDDCPCGRKGKYFKILGRLKNAEIRGCSDTYAKNFEQQSGSSDLILSSMQFLVGKEEVLTNMSSVSAKQPFSEEIIEFLDDVSKELMKNKMAKAFSDVVSWGFWIRRASLHKLKERFLKNDELRMGRGVAFHIAPSNVPVNFAYSLVAGLVCGNANVVRVPSKDFPQVTIICDAIENALASHPQIRDYICLVRYERNDSLNQYLSNMCDVRIIWGGDATIESIRKSAIGPRATEITFADRYSLAVIDSDFYINSDSKERIASDFYNDTYLTDQNACTSPRVVVWTGNQKEKAKSAFWKALHEITKEKYNFQPVMAVDKLTKIYQASADASQYSVRCKKQPDNLIVRAEVLAVDSSLMDYRGNCGYFYEYDCDDVMELRGLCDDNRCQTIGVLGNTESLKPLVLAGVKGIDRIVAIGHTMDFDLEWDGYNLVERLTRGISL